MPQRSVRCSSDRSSIIILLVSVAWPCCHFQGGEQRLELDFDSHILIESGLKISEIVMREST